MNLVWDFNGIRIGVNGTTRYYYVDGKLSRLDGPAVLYVAESPHNEYYIDSKEYTEDEFNLHPLVAMLRFVNGK